MLKKINNYILRNANKNKRIKNRKNATEHNLKKILKRTFKNIVVKKHSWKSDKRQVYTERKILLL